MDDVRNRAGDASDIDDDVMVILDAADSDDGDAAVAAPAPADAGNAALAVLARGGDGVRGAPAVVRDELVYDGPELKNKGMAHEVCRSRRRSNRTGECSRRWKDVSTQCARFEGGV